MKNKAFTLIELLVVIVIIGILATITTATFNNYNERAEEAKILAERSDSCKEASAACSNDDIANDLCIFDDCMLGLTPEACFPFSSGSIFQSYAWNCQSDVGIPDTIGGVAVTRINSYAFMSQQITSVTIPDSVTTIGDYSFVNNHLTSVIIPDNVTVIGPYTFFANPLTSVSLKAGTTYVSADSFPPTCTEANGCITFRP